MADESNYQTYRSDTQASMSAHLNGMGFTPSFVSDITKLIGEMMDTAYELGVKSDDN